MGRIGADLDSEIRHFEVMLRGMQLAALALVAVSASAVWFVGARAEVASVQDTNAPASSSTSSAANEPTRAVLVTGASTGIGRSAAELFAGAGWLVYAGARSAEDLAELDALEGVTALRLDVTVQADIDAAVERVRAGEVPLEVLVNNAGVVTLGPIAEMSDADLRFQFDVNVFGVQRVTRAFAPLLVESKGRVITTGSISGVATWSLGGAYTMSKHAIEAFGDTLGAELALVGVQSCVIEPGNFRSAIMDNAVKRMVESGYSPEGSMFEEQMRGFLEGPGNRSEEADPIAVAQAMLDVATAEKMPRRRMVVPNAGEAAFTLRAHVQRLVELNAGHEYTLSRDELVKLVDDALAASR